MDSGRRESQSAADPTKKNGAARSRRCLAFRKDGHVYAFAYDPQHERAALEAFASCPGADPAEVLALVCYLGYDPRALELDID